MVDLFFKELKGDWTFVTFISNRLIISCNHNEDNTVVLKIRKFFFPCQELNEKIQVSCFQKYPTFPCAGFLFSYESAGNTKKSAREGGFNKPTDLLLVSRLATANKICWSKGSIKVESWMEKSRTHQWWAASQWCLPSQTDSWRCTCSWLRPVWLH